jgi:hypothetical protein
MPITNISFSGPNKLEMALLYSMFQVHQGLGGLDGHLEQDRFT